MADDVILLRPVPSSVGVQLHPHAEGDVVSIIWTDANGKRYLLATDTSTAELMGHDLVTATTDPDIQAEADRRR